MSSLPIPATIRDTLKKLTAEKDTFAVNTFYEDDLLGRRCAGNSTVIRNLSFPAIKRSGAIEGREKARGRADGERLALKRRRGTDKRRSRDVSSARILRIADSSDCGTAGREKFLSSIRRRHTRTGQVAEVTYVSNCSSSFLILIS